jgi:hypothetical protein
MDSGLDSDLLDWKKCVGDAVARVAAVVFVFENYPFSYSVYCIPKKGQTKLRPHFFYQLHSHK